MLLHGGELITGTRTDVYGDLFAYSPKRDAWLRLSYVGAPAPRAGHAGVVTARGGGQLWLYGGEVASPSGARFRHYTELWCLHLAERRWEEIKVPGAPMGRSGEWGRE